MLLSEAIKAARQGFLPSSLVGRVFALYCLTWMLCVSIGGAMFIKNEFEERIEAIQRQSVMLIELTSQVTSEAAVIGDYDSVQRVLDISVSNSFFFIAQYIDLSGGKLQSRANLPAQRGAVARLIEPSIEERLPPVNRSITVGGKDYGILRFQFEARSLSNSLQDFTLVTFLVSLVSFSLGILLLWIPLRRWLRPLSDVTRGNEHAAVIGMTPELMQSAPAEFHAVLSQVVTSAEQLQTQLEEKERNISGLMEVATKLKGGESANEELISTKLSIAEAIDAISKMVSERAAINSALVAAKHSAEEDML